MYSKTQNKSRWMLEFKRTETSGKRLLVGTLLWTETCIWPGSTVTWISNLVPGHLMCICISQSCPLFSAQDSVISNSVCFWHYYQLVSEPDTIIRNCLYLKLLSAVVWTWHYYQVLSDPDTIIRYCLNRTLLSGIVWTGHYYQVLSEPDTNISWCLNLTLLLGIVWT